MCRYVAMIIKRFDRTENCTHWMAIFVGVQAPVLLLASSVYIGILKGKTELTTQRHFLRDKVACRM